MRRQLIYITPLFVILALRMQLCECVGGKAEMKALTGDAPYLGTGNQEQAPEFFGEALMRQYQQNPAYYQDYYGSRYARNYYRSVPYQNYGPGYGGGFIQPLTPFYHTGVQMPMPFVPSAGLASSPFGGGFYTGRGNSWAN